MKLATFSDSGASRIGLAVDDAIVDLSRAAPELPTEMVAFLEAGDEALARARAALTSTHRLPLSKVALHAPIRRPPEFMIVGANYADHAEEATKIKGTGLDHILKNKGQGQEIPLLINKQTTCVTGPYDDIHMPKVSKEHLDYEGELGFVIGKSCKHVSYEDAKNVIVGYTIINDVSVRDWQLKTPFPTFGKSFDTHGPMGPWIVTADEVDPHALNIRTLVNHKVRQDSNTKHLIFDCYRIVEIFSKAFTLRAGTVIATGTMAGVGIAMDPPGYLKVGDVVEVEVEGIGKITNNVIDEPDGYVAR